ncbi:MAG: DUF5681 domain-containing protein [Spirochaetaceae bacterium]|nr:DUF5681 domain-containing protein [Spirochaetaceae bacterium]
MGGKGKPFEKGKSGNPSGRPVKGTAITDILNFKLDQLNESGILRREVIAEKLLQAAESGDIAALKYVTDRLDGRPKESLELMDNVDNKLKDLLK